MERIKQLHQKINLKKMAMRALALFVALTMLIALLPAADFGGVAYAAELPAEEVSAVVNKAAENPVSAFPSFEIEIGDIQYVDPSESISAYSDSPVYLTSVEENGAILREAMEARKTELTLYHAIPADNLSQESVDVLFNDLFAVALTHTGEPTEGDYLNFHIAGCGASILAMIDRNTALLDFTITLSYYTSAKQEAELDKAFATVMANLNLTGMSAYEKVLAIYNYITSNVVYDYDNLNDDNYTLKYSAYAALVNKTSVCQGYANLFYRMALAAGLDCRMISGTSHGEGHSWNIVKIGDVYYNVDSTWDSTYAQNGLPYGYLLKCNANFDDHNRDAEYRTAAFNAAYPMATKDYKLITLTEPQQEGNYTYTVTNSLATITAYTGSEKNVVVPATLGGFPVDVIGHMAFSYNDAIETLVFSEGVRFAGQEHLFACHGLKSVHYPSTLRLGENDLSTGLSAVPKYCESLAKITVDEDNPYMTVYDGVLYTKDMTTLLRLPEADPREVLVIPEGVLYIGNDSCSDNPNIKEVIMPNTVKNIGYWSFIGCKNLEKINISENCTTIGQYAFTNTSLTSLHIPASVLTIMWGSIGHQCPLEKITVDKNNPFYYAIDNVLFSESNGFIQLEKYPSGKKQTEYMVPEGTTHIQWYAFSDDNNLEKVIFPESLKEIGGHAFDDAVSLETLVFNGKAPVVDNIFGDNKAYTAYYRLGDGTWTNNAKAKFDASMTWKTICAGNHSYNTTATKADCVTDGSTVYTCTKCDYSYMADFEAAWGHKYTTAVIAPKCEHYGYTTHTCTVCGDSYESDRVPQTGHTEVIDKAVLPTCTETGLTEGKHCSVCGKVFVAQTTLKAKGHTEVIDKAVAATCTENGITEGRHCSVCSKVIVAQTTVKAKGHTEVIDKAVAATCTKSGLTQGKHCSVCSKVLVAQTTVAALGHKWKESTCTASSTCTVCGAKSGKPTGHSYTDGVDGTCNTCGVHRETTENRTVMHMFRMYDPNSGEHFYTGSEVERQNLINAGWNYEGVGFTFSMTTGAPVYRLFDPKTGEHLYTMDEEEKATLLAAGWNFEGIAFNSAYDTEVPQYRLHNPNETRGAYHFTASTVERDNLIALGWEYQGIGFYSSWK